MSVIDPRVFGAYDCQSEISGLESISFAWHGIHISNADAIPSIDDKQLYMNDTLDKIGQFVEDFDEKYINKIASATTDYLNSITVGKAVENKGTFGGSPKGKRNRIYV